MSHPEIVLARAVIVGLAFATMGFGLYLRRAERRRQQTTNQIMKRLLGKVR